ncbi:MAG: hypothetical protein QM831_09895 [Kofleriaceae bacterium]
MVVAPRGGYGIRRWARLAGALHRELREVADLAPIDPRWWVLAGGAALPWSRAGSYVINDADAESDTFMGVTSATADPLALALAARTAIRELDGALPAQPLAVTVKRGLGASVEVSDLGHAAFARGDRVIVLALDDRAPALLARFMRGEAVPSARAIPFVCVTLGSEPIATARHGHRRAWVETSEGDVGPWLGLSRADGMLVVSTCHMVVDGYGHGVLSARIAELVATSPGVSSPAMPAPAMPAPAIPAEAIALDIATRDLPSAPRALELAYRLGCTLHRMAGRPDARFSPTFQIPVAPGTREDPERFKRRIVPAIASVRFLRGTAEPFDDFAARTANLLAREAEGIGVSAHLLAAAQGAPAPLAWKRRAVGPARPRWLESISNLIGGRGCVSKIVGTPAVAVSSPSRSATDADPFGGCVVTVVGDDARATITIASSGMSAHSLLDELV